MGGYIIEPIKDFYNDIGNMVSLLVENPYTALLIVGVIIIFTTLMLMITRHTYTRIVRMIDEGEKRAIEKRVEEWGEMIINNVQQECMERKLSLTVYSFILPALAFVMIAFSIYKLDLIPNLILTVVHLAIVFIILFIVKLIRGKGKKRKKQSVNSNALADTDND